MGPRANHLRLDSDELGKPLPPPKFPFQMDLPSPRVGEVPPALSPLDAFAMHSRMLAKRFEEPRENGRRVSRLHYNDVAKELANRPDYFRTISNGSDGGMSAVPEVKEENSPTSPKYQNLVAGGSEKDRPKSHYPMFGNAGKQEKERDMSTPTPFFDALDEQPESNSQDYFGVAVPRATSPEPVDPKTVHLQPATPTNMPSLTNSVDSISSTQPRTLTNGSTRSYRSLAPPRSPAVINSPRSMQSIRSVPLDSGDEDGSVSGSHPVYPSRKFSGSSAMSRPQSPFSPHMPPMHRTPSTTSEFSINGSQRRMNFSRKLSSGSTRPQLETRPSYDSRSSFETRPSTELPHRHPSAASWHTPPSSGVPSRQTSGDDAATPIANETLAVHNEANTDETDDRPTTAYTYRSYSLPRGRAVERDSRGSRESWIQRQFTWDKDAGTAPEQTEQVEKPLPQPPSLEPPRPASPAISERIPRERQDRLGRDRAMSSANRSRSAEPRTVALRPGEQGTMQKAAILHKSTASVKTSSTDRTIRPTTSSYARSGSTELTAEEHLEIGIQTHSAGDLSKSTYHLRIAAREGSPTGMLLYALACRHGWGMRPNQEEGVRWLKKAIDGAGLEVADVEQTIASTTTTKADPIAQAQERKKRKSQFALAIYELGISYMNGWGCPKDKPLAVQCYEVAGSWGDCDALAEAGFCYTQGLGVKKNVNKAASLYRRAAEGGMSMAGNSWIYKPKYMDEDAKLAQKEKTSTELPLSSISKDAKEKEAKPSGRARSRSIWGRGKKEKV
ncbi:hypothetical protein LTR37_004600 [Vermiconidia calcicola]|uniref:Uncharacterized protein n=1 Tax=Vermiconidia calcicola TaxID=1690605 RepID=A0ACC3NLR2_9PEZI|nr:hypothetical protein LTR37_004600 [Vermiconidia calcicola]